MIVFHSLFPACVLVLLRDSPLLLFVPFFVLLLTHLSRQGLVNQPTTVVWLHRIF